MLFELQIIFPCEFVGQLDSSFKRTTQRWTAMWPSSRQYSLSGHEPVKRIYEGIMVWSSKHGKCVCFRPETVVYSWIEQRILPQVRPQCGLTPHYILTCGRVLQAGVNEGLRWKFLMFFEVQIIFPCEFVGQLDSSLKLTTQRWSAMWSCSW